MQRNPVLFTIATYALNLSVSVKSVFRVGEFFTSLQGQVREEKKINRENFLWQKVKNVIEYAKRIKSNNRRYNSYIYMEDE